MTSRLANDLDVSSIVRCVCEQNSIVNKYLGRRLDNTIVYLILNAFYIETIVSYTLSHC